MEQGQQRGRHGVTEFLRAFEDVGATFFDLETDILITLDEKGNIKRVNPSFERLLNRRERDVIGLGMMHLIRVDDWATFLRNFTSVNPPPIRLLKAEHGEIAVRLIAFRFKAQVGYLVLRKIAETP